MFKVKKDQDGIVGKYKARLVARGDLQREGIDYDEVFAPVTRMETIRTLLAISVIKGMHVHQMDVVAAYVQGNLTDEIYMEQPKFFENLDARNMVCKLNKPLYGLKQAGREWYRKLDSYLLSLEFNKTAVNPCVYVKSDIIITIYVDDLLIASADIDKINLIKELLKREFKIKDLGIVKDILGMRIERNGTVGSIKLSQKKYIQDVLEKFAMTECNPLNTPLEINLDMTKIRSEAENVKCEPFDKPYRELTGCLVYLANASRPDIAFAASVLCRFSDSATEVHWKMAKRVLRYLKGTIDYSIKYDNKNEHLSAFVNSDWAGDNSDRKSCTGFVLKLAGGPVSWNSRKQKSVALSTMEAEYMALSEVTKEVIYMRNLLQHMKICEIVDEPTVVHCDNQSCIQLCKNSVHHARSKHIDIRFHFSKEAQERGEIQVKYLRSIEMTADILTKSLSKEKHVAYVQLLNLK